MYPLAVLNIFAEPAFVEAIRVLIISHHPFWKVSKATNVSITVGCDHPSTPYPSHRSDLWRMSDKLVVNGMVWGSDEGMWQTFGDTIVVFDINGRLHCDRIPRSKILFVWSA
jgi:hypothetical protein